MLFRQNFCSFLPEFFSKKGWKIRSRKCRSAPHVSSRLFLVKKGRRSPRSEAGSGAAFFWGKFRENFCRFPEKILGTVSGVSGVSGVSSRGRRDSGGREGPQSFEALYDYLEQVEHLIVLRVLAFDDIETAFRYYLVRVIRPTIQHFDFLDYYDYPRAKKFLLRFEGKEKVKRNRA